MNYKIKEKLKEAFEGGLSPELSYETLKKIAHGVDVAKDATWFASAALANSPTNTVLRSVIGGTETATDILRYKTDDSIFNEPRKSDKYLSVWWTGIGSLSLGGTVADVVSGNFSRIPADASFAAASYLTALSKGLHYMADKKC